MRPTGLSDYYGHTTQDSAVWQHMLMDGWLMICQIISSILRASHKLASSGYICVQSIIHSLLYRLTSNCEPTKWAARMAGSARIHGKCTRDNQECTTCNSRPSLPWLVARHTRPPAKTGNSRKILSLRSFHMHGSCFEL